jgi:uncharacterized protein
MMRGMIWLYLVLGVAVGIVSGMIGIGGGILIVPALVYFFHMSQHRAQGTSLGTLLAPIGILAFLVYYRAGNVDVKAAVMIAIGFALGGYFGGVWAQHVSEVVLRRAFGGVLILAGLKMLLQKGL